MCANYIPVTESDTLMALFGVPRRPGDLPHELYPTGVGPFIRLVNDKRELGSGQFGMLPPWRRELKYGRKTYNARSETVHAKPSFRDAWLQGLRCVVPAWAVFEPRYYDDLSHERWRIEKADGTPFGIAGIYNQWTEDGEEKFSYAMLTVNADAHPFYSQFHEPGVEKRMPLFLDAGQYDEWMSCPLKDAPRFFRMWMGEMRGAEAPRMPKKNPAARKAAQESETGTIRPPAEPPAQGGLF